jgi:Phosphoinositide phospholipase C, Ca2+-dependent
MLLRFGWRGKAGVAALALGLAITVPAIANAGSPTTATTYGTGVRLNQIQVVGTHESYHLEATPAEKAIREAQSPTTEHEFEYTASPIAEQLGSQNVRQLEFDVWADPNGGLYANPLLRQLAGEGAYDPVMLQPGTKVLQAQDVDYNTRCLTLVACLRLVKAWSDTHQSAVPIAIMLEFHDELLTAPGQTDPVPGTVVPLAWTRDRMLALEQELLSVFPRNRTTCASRARPWSSR